MLNGYIYKNKELVSTKDPEEAFRSRAKFWLDYKDISKDDIAKLAKLIDLHPVTIEDLQGEEETTRTKYENFNNYTFIAYSGIKTVNKDYVEPKILYLIIGKNFIITVHKEEYVSIDRLKNNKNRINNILSKGVDYMLHTLIDQQVDKYYPIVEKLEKSIDRSERRILREKDDKELNNLFDKKAINKDLRNLITPTGRVVMQILKPGNDFIGKGADIYFRDVYDNIIRVNESLQSTKEQMAGIVAEHNATLSSKMNDTMKVLTIIATIMLPLTLITGIYGMNLPILPGGRTNTSFYAIMGVMLAIAVLMLAYFKKRRWI